MTQEHSREPTGKSPGKPAVGSETPGATGGGASRHEEYLRTDHLLTNLKGRAISGGFITATSQALRFVLYMGSTMILARLLAPADFGLVAMVGALAGLLRLFREGGLATATVQQDKISQAQVSNLFWINAGLGAVAAIIFAALAPAVGWFYRDARLVGIALLLAPTFLFSGVSVQPLAVLNRQMRFKMLALIDIGALVAGIGTGIGMAWSGFGYWALVGSQLVTPIAEVLLVFVVCGWRPQWPKARTGTRSLVNFGASLTVSTLLRRLADGTDTLLLGRCFGADAVGFYSRALVLLARPMDQFIGPFDAVFIPLLSRLQSQPERYRNTFLQAYNAIALLSFPMAGLLLALSRPLVFVLLGERWDAVIPLFGWISIAAVFIPLSYASMWLLVTQGRSRDILMAGVAFSLITITAVATGLPFGALGVALAFAVSGLLVRLPVQFYIAGRSGPVRTGDLWAVFFRHLIIYGAVAGTTWLARLWVSSLVPLAQICICVPIGLAVAAALILAVPTQRRLAANVLAGFKGVFPGRRPASPASAP